MEKKKKKKRVHYYLYSPGSTLSTGGSRDLPKSAFSVHFHAHSIYVHSFVEKVYDYDTFTCLHSSIEALFLLGDFNARLGDFNDFCREQIHEFTYKITLGP